MFGTLILILLNDDITPDEPGLMSVGVGNDGTADIDVGTLSLTGDPEFSIEVDPASNTTLVPGQQVFVKVRVDVSAPGTFTGTLRVPSSDPDGTLEVDLTVVVAAALIISMAVSPTGTVDFGSVDKDTGSKTLPFTVTNTGTAPLVMGTVAKTGADYAKSMDGVSGATIPPGATQGLYVIFDPTTVGTKTGTLTFPATGVSSVVVNLTGVATTGAPAPTPTRVTRFYLTRQASPVATIPADGAWTGWGIDHDYLLATSRGGPVSAWAEAIYSDTPGKYRLARFVGPLIAAQAIDAAILCYAIGYRSSALGTNVTAALRFGLLHAGGSVTWGPILAPGAVSSPWPTSTAPAPRRFPAGTPNSWRVTGTAVDGDRPVVELGFRVFTSAYGGARVRYGGASTDGDLASTEAPATVDLSLAAWIEFSGGLLVLP